MKPQKRSSHRLRSAFSLTELIVGMGIVTLLAALLTPAVRNSIEASRSAACASNLSQIGKSFFAYANDNDGRLPSADTGGTWPMSTVMYQLNPYLGNRPTSNFEQQKQMCFGGVFRCPGKKDWNLNGPTDVQRVSYGMNTFAVETVPKEGLKLTSIESPGKTALMADLQTGWWAIRNAHYMYRDFKALRHQNRDNVLFCDGHVEQVKQDGLTWDLKLLQ